MADKKAKKDSGKESSASYTGKDIDKKLQEKVDSYMDPRAKNSAKQTGGEEAKGVSGAPLLPSDKIPKSVTGGDDKEKPLANEKQPPTELPPPKPEPKQASAYDDWPDPETKKAKNLNLEDNATSQAVDEIVAAESDKLLETEDKVLAAKRAQAEEPKKDKGPKKPFYKRGKFYKWLFILLFAGLATAMAIPDSRYPFLNSLGVRASTSMRVVDQKTGQPLKNVEVTLAEQSATTGRDGEARLYDLRLGKQNMTVSKPAFAELSREATIGWGSNPLGDMELKPVGAQYRFVLTDYLSGLPINKVEANSGEADAVSSEKGELTLVVEETSGEAIEVTLRADGYRDEKVKVSPDKQELREIAMVPSRKHAFISKRSGTYDLYKTDIDGKNEKLILAGTGTESEDGLILVNHPTDETAAFVSVRGDERDSLGGMLGTLRIIDLNTNESKSVVSSSRIQIVDWVGEKLVYIKEQNDKKPDDPSRHKLMSYDYKSGIEIELASANYFNDVSIAKGTVYYSPAGNGKQTGLYAIAVDSSGKKAITDKEVWNIFRTAYGNLRVSLGQQWYDYGLDSGSFGKAPGPPSVLKSRVYYDSPDRTKSIWSEDRDGKGALILFDHAKNEDKTMLAKSGLKNPLRWLNNSVVIFRIDDGQETADYAMSLDGGKDKKITDVTNVTGIDRWYFY
jgi:hypothetical protein